MDFSPAFRLLPKFTVGLDAEHPSDAERLAAAKYLGVELPEANPNDRISMVSRELSRQNGFLSKEIAHGSIFRSKDYSQSNLIREVVANNRLNRARAPRLKSEGTTPSVDLTSGPDARRGARGAG